MIGIGSFFERIKSRFADEFFFVGFIQGTIKKHTGLEIKADNIKLQSFTLMLPGLTSAERNVIFIKKAAILKDLADGQKKKVIRDIR